MAAYVLLSTGQGSLLGRGRIWVLKVGAVGFERWVGGG